MFKKRVVYLIVLILTITTVSALNVGTINLFVIGNDPPTFAYNNTNVSAYAIGEAISHNIEWLDDSQLEKNYFETNITGIPANSTTDLSGTNQFVNQTRKPLYLGKYYWKSLTLDTSGNWNTTNKMLIEITQTTTSTTTTIFTPAAAPPATSGGRSSGSRPVFSDFLVNTDLIEAEIKQGENIRKSITITNIGETTLKMEIDPRELRRFMVVSEELFILKPKESKVINIDIFAREKEIPDAYTGRLLVKSEGIIKSIGAIIEVSSKRILFDIKTKLLRDSIKAGEPVNAEITLINFGDIKPVDVALYYAIKDFNDNIITFKEETLAVNEEITIRRSLVAQENLPTGNYIFYSRVKYNGEFDIDGDLIKITSRKQIQLPAIMDKFKPSYLYLILIILAIILIIAKLKEKKKKPKTDLEKMGKYIKKRLKE